jgi:hypothetical protein
MEFKKEISNLDSLSDFIDVEGFWYALTREKKIKPDELLASSKDSDKLKKAIETVREFENGLDHIRETSRFV